MKKNKKETKMEIISEDFSMMKNKKFDEFRALKVNIKTKKFKR